MEYWELLLLLTCQQHMGLCFLLDVPSLYSELMDFFCNSRRQSLWLCPLSSVADPDLFWSDVWDPLPLSIPSQSIVAYTFDIGWKIIKLISFHIVHLRIIDSFGLCSFTRKWKFSWDYPLYGGAQNKNTGTVLEKDDYPMVCCSSRLNRKHEVKSLILSTHTTWSADLELFHDLSRKSGVS
jgi:hypothetical protein